MAAEGPIRVADLERGGPWVEIDPRLEWGPEEPVILKKGASAVLWRNLTSQLIAFGVDTVVLCGASTGGCVRATAVDLVQYGWPDARARECVGNRTVGPQEVNLFDIQSNCADVVPFEEALVYVGALGAEVR